MSKKTKRDKEIAKLRREVEALRAQVKVSKSRGVNPEAEQVRYGAGVSREKEVNAEPEAEAPTVVADVRADLKKTAVLTAVGLIILLILSLTQSRWPFLP
jgi:hypothetical protein